MSAETVQQESLDRSPEALEAEINDPESALKYLDAASSALAERDALPEGVSLSLEDRTADIFDKSDWIDHLSRGADSFTLQLDGGPAITVEQPYHNPHAAAILGEMNGTDIILTDSNGNKMRMSGMQSQEGEFSAQVKTPTNGELNGQEAEGQFVDTARLVQEELAKVL